MGAEAAYNDQTTAMALSKDFKFPFDRGDRVEHSHFGKGRVQQSLGASGEDEKILVRFDSGEERIILSTFLSNISGKVKVKAPRGRKPRRVPDIPSAEVDEESETEETEETKETKETKETEEASEAETTARDKEGSPGAAPDVPEKAHEEPGWS